MTDCFFFFHMKMTEQTPTKEVTDSSESATEPTATATETTPAAPLYEAMIKKEYLLPPLPKAEVEEKDDKESASTDSGMKRGPGEMKAHGTVAAKRARAETARAQRQEVKLCDAVARGHPEECPHGGPGVCRFSHDVEAYMAAKPKDLDGVCPWEAAHITCPFGLRCRFAGRHGKGYEDPTKEAEVPAWRKEAPVQPRNTLKKELQSVLRKRDGRKYPVADKVMAELEKAKQTKAEAKPTESSEAASAPAPAAGGEETKRISGADRSSGDVEIRMRPEEKRRIDWEGKMLLPPLTTVGNLPFRRICKKFGVDITCGEMAMASNLLSGQASEWALLKRHPCEDIFGIQLASSRPQELAKCAELLEETLGADGMDFVDLNAACPIDVMCNKGCCAALLEKPGRMRDLLQPMARILSCPVTVKLRTGRDEKNPTILNTIIPNLREWGVDAAVVHGRSRMQRYAKLSDWEYIGKCVKASPVPILGNGDIFTSEDYERARSFGVAGVSIARAALSKPWIFTEIKEHRLWDISASERLSMLEDFAHHGLEHWGSDTQGVEHTRMFMCHWLSFLYKYVPVGLLEVLPPHINDRVPRYFGRSDLETLFASPLATDWVKITEMFLGPAPESFHFVPRHKSNTSYG